jgi:hypothetical protein
MGNAKQQTNYGRIYNVQDYIDSAPSGLSLTKETIGFRRCFTTLMEKIYKYCETTNDTDKIFTILVPLNTGIGNTIVPYNINDKLVAVRNDLSNNWFRPYSNYHAKITINIIGLSINDSTLKSKMSTYLNATETEQSSFYIGNIDTQTFYLSKQIPNYTINGIESNTSFNTYLDSVMVDIGMMHSTNPADTNFLSYNTGTTMPIIQSTNPVAHNFIYLRTSGQNDTDAYIYPPETKNPNDLPNTEINICGLKLEGINQTNNSAVYVDTSQQQNFTFKMGTGIHIENFKSVFIDNIIIENMYGNGITIYNRDYAYINDTVKVNRNVIKNVWGLKYRQYCNNLGIKYDDTGDALRFEGIDSGESNSNYIYNDLSYTKQFGRIGLATCSEHNRNTIADSNYIHGYDRNIHSENNLSGFKIRYNRITGSETGIVFDGNRDYTSNYFCPKANKSEISYNYISNEGIVYHPNLQKIYPPHLFFSPVSHRTNEYYGTEISNNEFVLDKANAGFQYSNDVAPVIKPNCTSNSLATNPRPYSSTLAVNNTNKYHIFSGLRAQKITCNYFKTINTNNTNFQLGGFYLKSFCANNVSAQYAGCEQFLDSSQTTTACNLNTSDTINATIPIEIKNNVFNDCEVLSFIHYHSSLSLSNLSNNFFINNTSTINSNISTVNYIQGIQNPLNSCNNIYNIPFQFANITFQNPNCANPSNSGKISLMTVGGIGTITYSISPTIGTQLTPGNFNDLPANTYIIMATDASNNSISTTITINNPPALIWSTITSTNALCNGANGSLNFNATGGTGNITYIVNGLSQTSPFSAPAGTYTVVASDINACSTSTILTITEPTAVVLTASATNALCNGINGSLNFNVTGGTSTIAYTVNGNAQTSPFSVPAGTYTVVASDINACSTSTILTITEPTAVVLTASATNTLCNGVNGSLSFSVTGGTGNIIYTVNGLSLTSPFAAPAGTYTIVASDANQCSNSIILIISEPPVLTWASINITNINCNNSNSGGIQVQANGGTSPYSYSILPNIIPSSPGNYPSLSAGNYTVSGTDANACSISTVISDLIDPNSGDFCCPNGQNIVLNTPGLILKSNPNASDLLAQFGNPISGKTFYIDGIFTINDNISFDACTFWFTPQAQIQVQGANQLSLNNCTLDAACDWWVGIEAIQAQNKVNIQGGEINNGVWSIHIANNAELVIDGTSFTGFGYGAITFNDITDSLYAAQVTGCTFTSTGNQTAAMNTQHIGIQLRNVRHLVIGDPNNTTNGNTFNGMRCGIHILGFGNINNVLNSNDNQIELYNNTFENIGFSPNQSNYSLFMNSIYTQPKGAGVYIDYSQAPSFSANTIVEYTGNLTSSTPTFNNCYKAIVSLNNNLTAKKQYIKDADFGIMNFNLMSKEVVVENNKIENAHIGTQLSGNYKYYNVFKNEIVTNAGVGISNAGFGIMAMMYPAIGIDIKQNNLPFVNGQEFLVDANTIRLPYYAGKGIANLGANQSQKIKNNTILFTVLQGTAYPPVAYQDPSLYGIYNTNSKDFTLSNNLVDGQYTQGVYNSTYSKAYYFETCKEMIISCNKGRATKQGLYAWGDNSTDKTKIKSNKFKFNLNPLYTLDNGSAQPGTFGNIGNGILDNNNFWLYNMPNGNGWLQNNIFKVWRNSNMPTPDQIITSSILLDNISSFESGSPGGNQYAYGVQNPPGMQPSDADCPAPDFGNSNPPISVITVNNADDIALNVAAQNEIYINYAQVGAWMNHLWLFERLRDNDSLRISSPVLQAFYNNYQNGTIGNISNTELALASLFNFSGTNQDFIFEYNNAINANNNIISLDDHENNMRFINSLSMKILRWGIDSLSAGEKLDIEVLANLCPFVGGSAVYKARVYNSLLNPMAQYNDRLICIQGQNKNNVNGFENLDSLYEAKTNLEAENLIQLSTHKALTTTTKFERIPSDKFEDIILYPNPANTFIYVSGVTENAVFELIDVLGKTIIRNNLTANIERQKIELPCLSNGIYAYKISFEKDIFCGMLNVIQDEK